MTQAALPAWPRVHCRAAHRSLSPLPVMCRAVAPVAYLDRCAVCIGVGGRVVLCCDSLFNNRARRVLIHDREVPFDPACVCAGGGSAAAVSPSWWCFRYRVRPECCSTANCRFPFHAARLPNDPISHLPGTPLSHTRGRVEAGEGHVVATATKHRQSARRLRVRGRRRTCWGTTNECPMSPPIFVVGALAALTAFRQVGTLNHTLARLTRRFYWLP